ncbi:DUF1697 domain-containing protein [Arthrobacter sp. EH-1B-1]|uniref:DUF1697 domain-containing protein n=1 Tax=Arthrobacter vasquezii TaxID=2977629 RepID=A0ABT6CV67_9MICC|nr:DUF1697 domain-containing protein [Arthrobacter vasquezii]MDF9277971.1 DUF1697 domain-containing protein [Arthrobacter vasquezii]
MTRYAVFLRGVNVGGVTIKSADLRATFEGLPVSGVRTLLASGNVVCSSDLTADELKFQSEQSLRQRFGYEAWVVVLDAATVGSIVEDCPFPADDPDTHTYLTLFSDPAVLTGMVEFAFSINEPVQPLGTIAAAWQTPKGGTLDSPLNAFTNRAAFKRATTTRNLRTLQKVLAALQG